MSLGRWAVLQTLRKWIRLRADILQLFPKAYCFLFEEKDTQLIAAVAALSRNFYCYSLFVKFSNFRVFFLKKGNVVSGKRFYLAHSYFYKVCCYA